MHFAIDPKTGSRITAKAFRQRYGTKTTTGLVYPPAECPYCHKDLFLRQGTKIIHFWHGPSMEYCPSKTPFGRPYMSLTPTQPDLAHAAALREQFKAEWQLHYQELERLIPLLSYKEFLSLLKEALSKNIFAYTGMTIEDIPYVLVLALDYVPSTSSGKKRQFWFRFWYETSIRCVDDLWIKTPADVVLIRASFTPPKPPVEFPDYDTGLIADKPRERQPFRQASLPKLPTFVVEEVTQWFQAHPSF